MHEYFTKDANICYRKNNFSENKKTLIFIHGLSGSLSAWKKFEEYYSNKYNIVTYDLRGHGLSHKYENSNDYSLNNFSKDLRSLVRELHIEKYNLVAHSFGVLIALDYYFNYSNEIESLILLSPSFSTGHKWIKVLLQYFRLPLGCDREQGRVDYDNYAGSGDWNLPRMYKDIKNTGLAIYLKCTEHSCSLDFTQKLNSISCPTLLIHGKKDSIFPVSDTIKFACDIKNAKLLIIENADHIIVLNNREEILFEMNKFLQT